MKKFNLLIILLSILFLTACGSRGIIGNYINDNSKQINNNVGVTEDKTVGAFQFTNATLVFEDEKSTFDVMVTNTTDKVVTLTGFIIKFYNEDELIKSVDVISTGILNAHDATSLHFAYNDSLMDATKVEYEIKK